VRELWRAAFLFTEKKCLRTSGLKAIMTSLPAAASNSDRRSHSHPDCRATDGSEWTGGDCTKHVTRGGTTNQAGKSSFLRAGLLPRLQRDDGNFLVLPVVRPERAAINGEAGLVHGQIGKGEIFNEKAKKPFVQTVR
jgi:hypothetical protein